MAVLIIKGEVKVGDLYHEKGDIITELSEVEEKRLVKAGVAELCDFDPDDYDDDDLEPEEMSMAQLKECANGNGIDIKGMTTKAQILGKINEYFKAMAGGNPEAGAGGA